MKAHVSPPTGTRVREPTRSHRRSQDPPPSEALSEAIAVQKVILVLGGHDGAPVFTRTKPTAAVTTCATDLNVLRVCKGARIAHLSPNAARACMRRYAPYGSCALLLTRLLSTLAEAGTCNTPPDKPLAPSLAALLETPHATNPAGYRRYCWSWPPAAQGLIRGLQVIWDEWSLLLSVLHRRFVSSLHREFCKVEAVPNAKSDHALQVVERRLRSRDHPSPFFRLYVDRFVKSDCFGAPAEADPFPDRGLSEFKVTLLNMEHCLRPFLTMLKAVTRLLEATLAHIGRHSLSADSLCRVATVMCLAQLRSSEYGHDSLLSSLWKFLLYHVLGACHLPPSFGTPRDATPDDRSWACLGGAFGALLRARGSVRQLDLHAALPSPADEPIDLIPPSTVFHAAHDTTGHVLRTLNTSIAASVRGTLSVFRAVLEDRHYPTAYLSFLSGFCCLRFGDCLDSVFALLSRGRVPLNYQSRLRELLYECTLEWRHRVGGVGISGISSDQVHHIVHSFDYSVTHKSGRPKIDLGVLGTGPSPVSSFLPAPVMAKYSSILSHLLSFQLFCADVKRLAGLTFRHGGTICGFFVPRASLLLLHVSYSLGQYYRWVVDSAWTRLVSRLADCRGVPEMSRLHESYVNFMVECLLVPLADSSAAGINALLSEPLFMIRRCATEFLRLLSSASDGISEDLESVYTVLLSEVSRLKATLSVLCSLVLPDLPAFGDLEHRQLPYVLRAKVDLNSGVCHAVSVLQRLLR